MIKLNRIILYTTTIVLFSALSLVPLISYSERVDDWWGVPEYQQMLNPGSSFTSGFNSISGIVHYQVRDNSDGLICIVQSDNITIYDSQLTFDYLTNHPSHTMFENDGGIINYVTIKESWNVGEGDTFLSALRNMIVHPETEKPYSIFFATTNGCAVQPGDKVTVIWEIIYD